MSVNDVCTWCGFYPRGLKVGRGLEGEMTNCDSGDCLGHLLRKCDKITEEHVQTCSNAFTRMKKIDDSCLWMVIIVQKERMAKTKFMIPPSEVAAAIHHSGTEISN